MTIQQAPRGKVAQRLLSATMALVLSTWMYPSLAATGTDARSDQPVDASPLSLSADHELPLPVIVHGAASTVTPDALPHDSSAAEAAQEAPRPPTETRVEIMLRQIFDEARGRQPTLQRPQEGDDFNPPLAVDQSEPREDPRGVLPADAAAQFPGFGADELLRYRQQMYRTDI